MIAFQIFYTLLQSCPAEYGAAQIIPLFSDTNCSVETNNSLVWLARWNKFRLYPFASQCCGMPVPVPNFMRYKLNEASSSQPPTASC